MLERQQMPDQKKLKIGDRVKFVVLPDEWDAPGCSINDEDVTFMQAMIARKGASRVFRIDEEGFPWIKARIKNLCGIEHHDWGIFEQTGWRLVRKRL